MENLIIAVLAVAIIVALTVLSDRLGIAPALILMLVGVGISFLPSMRSFTIPPELILSGILPPLLYSAAIAIPTVELRRDFMAVGALAVILVVVSAVVLGLIIHWIIPGVSIPLGIAIGAVLSPTDAAATTVVKRLGVPGRVGVILQGESLLNDATALVVLRSAIAATATTMSVWGVVGDFLWAAGIAAVIGIIIGWLGVKVREIVTQPTAATAISFLIPFVAYIPTELVDASGLVAVVAAGITAAQMGPKRLDARQRVAERSNWKTVEFLLEGAVFLGMGLELYHLYVDVIDKHESLGLAIGVALLAFVVLLVVRMGFLFFLIWRNSSSRKVKVGKKIQKTRDEWSARLADGQHRELPASAGTDSDYRALPSSFPFLDGSASTPPMGGYPSQIPQGEIPSLTPDDFTVDGETQLVEPSTIPPANIPAFPPAAQGMWPDAERRLKRMKQLSTSKRGRKRLNKMRQTLIDHQDDPSFQELRQRKTTQFMTRTRRFFADVDYLVRQPLGAKEGVLLTWAGMRGVVTLAAAQTLPLDVTHRSLLILIAFFVASGSLVIQGGTLGRVVKALGLAGQDAVSEEEWERLQRELAKAADDSKAPEGHPIDPDLVPLFKISVQRDKLLELRSTGTYSFRAMSSALSQLDAEEISLQLKLSANEE